MHKPPLTESREPSDPDQAAPSSKILLRLNNAGIVRNKKWLVRNVNLEIQRGEIVTIIGPNGSGKSTTAKLALGILKPNEGDVQHFSNLKIGYVPQKITLDPSLPLSVERMMRMTSPLSTKDCSDALDSVGISHLAKAEMAYLSGGEVQRVMLARAFARKPDLLVLDEPLQGVDFAGEAELYEQIAQFRQRTGCGVLLISHDLHIVMAATDRVICLNGHICCSGTPTDVAASPEYARLFGIRSKSPVALYTHHHDHTHLPDGRVQHSDGTIADDCNHQHQQTKGNNHA